MHAQTPETTSSYPTGDAAQSGGAANRPPDAAELKSHFRGQWAAVVPAVTGLPAELFDGRHHPCPLPGCGGEDRLQFSDVDGNGSIHCRGCDCKSGDGIGTIQKLTGWTFPETLKRLAEYRGGPITGPAEGKAADAEAKRKSARRTWEEATAKRADIALTYLRSRGPTVETLPPDLRGAASVYHNGGKARPAMLARITTPDGEQTALHRTYLTADYTAKADVPKPKMALGTIGGGAVHLGEPVAFVRPDGTEGKALALTEGIETGLAVMQATGLPVWACTSASALKGVRLPDDVTDVFIFADHDGEASHHAGQRAAADLARKAQAKGRLAFVVLPEREGDDWLDVLTRDGPAAIKAAHEAAKPWTAPAGEVDHAAAAKGRSQILIDPNEHEHVETVIRAIAGDPALYQRASRLVSVRTDTSPAGADSPAGPRVVELTDSAIRDAIARHCYLTSERTTKNGQTVIVHVHPPAWLVRAVAEYGQRADYPGVRHLTAVTDCPTMRRDGSIVEAAGYDVPTGLFLALSGAFPPVPDRPTLDDARKAVATLAEPYCDVPFATEADRSVALAFPMTVLARSAIPGPTPGAVATANVRGAGKTLALGVGCIIATGRDEMPVGYPADDGETDKRLTAFQIEGAPIVFFDNVVGTFGDATLNAALTSTWRTGRVLKESRTHSGEWRAVVAATGNNVLIDGDTLRRVAVCELCSPEEKPEDRDGFRFPNLREHVRQNRPLYVTAALTVLRAYVVAGRPFMKLTPWGSFEAWSALVRSALVWAGMPDPAATRREMQEHGDVEANALAAILDGLDALDPQRAGLTAGELWAATDPTAGYSSPEVVALREAILELCPVPAGKSPSTKSIGRRFKHLLRRVVGGRCLDNRSRKNQQTWFVRPLAVVPGGFGGFDGFVSPATRVVPAVSEYETSRTTNQKAGNDSAGVARKPPNPPNPPANGRRGECPGCKAKLFDGRTCPRCRASVCFACLYPDGCAVCSPVGAKA